MNKIDFARLVDRYVGDFLCFLLGALSKKKPFLLKKPKNFLVIRLWTLGESLLCLPMIKHLKSNFPESELTILVTNRSKAVFENHDFINHLKVLTPTGLFKLIFSLRHYDVVIDTEPYFRLSGLLAFWFGKYRIGFDHGLRAKIYSSHGNFNKKNHVVYSMASLLKPLKINYEPLKLISLPFKSEQAASLQMKINQLGTNKILIGMHTGTAESVKERAWPIHHFIKLIDLLTEKNSQIQIVMVGKGDYDFNRNEEIFEAIKHKNQVFNWANKLSFGEFCSLFEKLELFVANDSGPMHLSAAQGAFTIGLFGTDTPDLYGPFPVSRNKAFYKNKELGIGPCSRPWIGRPSDCTEQIKALHSISPKEVGEYILNKLNRHG